MLSLLTTARAEQGTSAFIGSAWLTHSMACKAMGIGLLAPSKSLLLTCLVTAWGARLAGYLFYRVLVVGKDGASCCCSISHLLWSAGNSGLWSAGAQQEPAADLPGHCLGSKAGRLPVLPRPRRRQ